MNISIVIPSFNSFHLLQKNLPNLNEILAGYKNGKVELIIVDDKSEDDSFTFIKNYAEKVDKSIKYISRQNEINKGFSSNVNSGVDLSSGEIVILLNTDVSPSPNFLEPLLKHFENEDVFAVGCLDESVEEKDVVLRGRGIGRWERGFLMHRLGDLRKTNTLWVSGGSGAFRKSMWDKLGGLDPFFNPFYWEDIDLSYRAQKAGYDLRFESKSRVLHEHEEGSIKNKFSSFQVRKIAYRNQFYFVWLNITDLGLILSHLGWLPYHLVSAVIRMDKAFIIGFVAALTHLPFIINKRGKRARLFSKKDKDVLSQFLREYNS